MNPDSTILHTVMRRVRTIHLLRATVPVAGACVLFVAALWGVGREVWVARVFENMPSVWSLPEMLSFVSGAFLQTEFLVQVLLIVAGAALVWGARSLARSLSVFKSLYA